MAACYQPDATFRDPVFEVKGGEVADMWTMLCERGRDLTLEWRDVRADDATGAAHWEPRYTFSVTGRPVHNRIDSRFTFRDGKIATHVDSFSLWRWTPDGARPQGRGARLGAVRQERDPVGSAGAGFESWRSMPSASSDAGATRPEPPFTHDRTPRIGILLTNLGTPDAPTPKAVRRYLAQFLSDPRVIEISPWAWKPLLHGVILNTRPSQVGAANTRRSGPRTARRFSCTAMRQRTLLLGYLGQRLKRAGGCRPGQRPIIAFRDHRQLHNGAQRAHGRVGQRRAAGRHRPDNHRDGANREDRALGCFPQRPISRSTARQPMSRRQKPSGQSILSTAA